LGFFSRDYFEAREQFSKAARTAGAKLERLKLQARGPQGEELSLETAIIGNPKSEKIVLHTSGIHGVEGYAGSAVQVTALEKFAAVPPKVPVIFVHTLNPFGMAWSRRVNEENVDLNRNFLLPSELYAGAHENYATLDHFLNDPNGPRAFWPALILYLWRLGFAAIKNAVAQGQYDFSNGLFFGGRSRQEGPRLLETWLRSVVGSPRLALTLDVHTGLGGFGEEVLFCHTNSRVPDLGKKVTGLSENIGYKVRGGLENLTAQIFSGAKWVHFTEEFGTHSMIKVLQALREENRAFQRARAVGQAQLRLRDTLTPTDEVWRANVVRNGVETLERAIAWVASQPLEFR